MPPAATPRRYRSQRDPRFVRLLRRAGGGFAAGGAGLYGAGLAAASDLVVVLGLVALALGIGCVWTLRVTWYEITDDHLRIRSGPSRMAIRWRDVLRVAPVVDRRNAPALSYERLRIDYRQGDHERSVDIAPEDRGHFLCQLRQRAPQLADAETTTATIPEA